MERGEATVTVMGQGFLNLPTLACRFGLTRSSQPAQFVSSEHIQCLTPEESEPGEVVLEVTLNSLDYTAQETNYKFLPMASLSQIAPETGDVNGGTPILLEGSGFAEVGREGTRLACLWEMPGSDPREVLSTPASVTSDSVLTCISPAAGQPGSARVSVSADDLAIADDVNNAIVFEYTLRATTTKLFPTHGQPSGGTRINVTGEGFIDQSGLTCRFHPVPLGRNLAAQGVSGAVDIPAEFRSTTEVHCLSPALDSIYPRGNLSGVGHALLEVSTREWSSRDFDPNRGLSFWYHPQPKVSVDKIIGYFPHQPWDTTLLQPRVL